jgi:hypothetical protein
LKVSGGLTEEIASTASAATGKELKESIFVFHNHLLSSAMLQLGKN